MELLHWEKVLLRTKLLGALGMNDNNPLDGRITFIEDNSTQCLAGEGDLRPADEDSEDEENLDDGSIFEEFWISML